MSERSMWNRLRPVLARAGLDPVRIETAVSQGIPDVNITAGWIELKWAAGWPKRGGPLPVPHFTAFQRAWLTRRCSAGGNALLLLQIEDGDEWLLFWGAVAAKHLGKATREELGRIARWQGKGPEGVLGAL